MENMTISSPIETEMANIEICEYVCLDEQFNHSRSSC